MSGNPYGQGLEKNQANYVPLSPLSYLERSAMVYPDRKSVVHGARSFTWSETYARCRRLASALAARGIGKGDTVAMMLSNVPAMYEAHFGVPMIGAVLNTLNTRLDAEAIAFMLGHGEAKVLITDPEFAKVVGEALKLLEGPKPLVIDALDDEFPGKDQLGEIEYEDFIAKGDENFAWSLPDDEWDPISLNYTSGTTGNPKGAMLTHGNLTSNVTTGTPLLPIRSGDVTMNILPLEIQILKRRLETGSKVQDELARLQRILTARKLADVPPSLIPPKARLRDEDPTGIDPELLDD